MTLPRSEIPPYLCITVGLLTCPVRTSPFCPFYCLLFIFLLYIWRISANWLFTFTKMPFRPRLLPYRPKMLLRGPNTYVYCEFIGGSLPLYQLLELHCRTDLQPAPKIYSNELSLEIIRYIVFSFVSAIPRRIISLHQQLLLLLSLRHFYTSDHHYF